MAQPTPPPKLEAQVDGGPQQGGRVLCGGKTTTVGGKGRFFDPCLIADANHNMPRKGGGVRSALVGVAKVARRRRGGAPHDDSPYGPDRLIWTRDQERAFRVGSQVESGTFFMNRCDYLDPQFPGLE